MTFLLARILRLPRRHHALILLGAAALCVLVGGAVFAATQHVAVTTGWYWAVTTATTVGYGDVTPKNASGRVVASIVMLTTIPLLAAAFALFTGTAVTNGMRRLLEMRERFPEGSYRLIVGQSPIVAVVLEELERAGDLVVVVADVDPGHLPEGVHVVRGDPTAEEVVARARPAGADHVLVVGDDDGAVLLSAVLVHRLAPQVSVTAVASSRRVVEALHDLGVDQVLSPDELTGHTVAKALEAPHAGDLLLELVDSEHHTLLEEAVPPEASPRPLSEIRADRAELVLGVLQGASVSLGVGRDPVVGPGDILLLLRQGRRNGSRVKEGQSAVSG